MSAEDRSELVHEEAEIRLNPPAARSNRQMLVLLAFTILFIIGVIGAFQLEIGRLSRPGPGLWPMLASILGLLVTFAAYAENKLRKNSGSLEDQGSIYWLRLLLFVIITFGFLVVYPLIGFLASGSVMMFLILMFVARAGWKSSILTAILSTASLYLIFVELLNVQI